MQAALDGQVHGVGKAGGQSALLVMGKLERDLVKFFKSISSGQEKDGVEGGKTGEGSLVRDFVYLRDPGNRRSSSYGVPLLSLFSYFLLYS